MDLQDRLPQTIWFVLDHLKEKVKSFQKHDKEVTLKTFNAFRIKSLAEFIPNEIVSYIKTAKKAINAGNVSLSSDNVIADEFVRKLLALICTPAPPEHHQEST